MGCSCIKFYRNIVGALLTFSMLLQSACAQELQDLKNLTISGENEVVANDIEHHTVNATKVASAACLPGNCFYVVGSCFLF